MDVIPKVDSADVGWALAGTGLVLGTLLIPKLPQVVGTWTSLVVGVALLVAAMKFIKSHHAAAFVFGLGFAFTLDGVIRLVMPAMATSTASYLNIVV